MGQLQHITSQIAEPTVRASAGTSRRAAACRGLEAHEQEEWYVSDTEDGPQSHGQDQRQAPHAQAEQ